MSVDAVSFTPRRATATNPPPPARQAAKPTKKGALPTRQRALLYSRQQTVQNMLFCAFVRSLQLPFTQFVASRCTTEALGASPSLAMAAPSPEPVTLAIATCAHCIRPAGRPGRHAVAILVPRILAFPARWAANRGIAFGGRITCAGIVGALSIRITFRPNRFALAKLTDLRVMRIPNGATQLQFARRTDIKRGLGIRQRHRCPGDRPADGRRYASNGGGACRTRCTHTDKCARHASADCHRRPCGQGDSFVGNITADNADLGNHLVPGLYTTGL